MLKALQEKYRDLLAKSETIRLKYEGKSETMTATETSEWTNILNEADVVKGQIETHEKSEALRAFGEKHANPLPTGQGQERNDKGELQVPETKAAQLNAQIKSVVEKLDRTGRRSLDDSDKETLKIAEKAAFSRFLIGGIKGLTYNDQVVLRAYQADSPASGGFLVAPQQFVQDLITLMKDLVFMRGMATVYTLDRAESLGIPSLDQDPADPDWTSELATGSEDTQMIYGKRELRPHPLAKRVKLSNKLLRQAAIDPEGLVRDRLGYKFGVAEEKAYLVGTGADQPLGVFTPSVNGISTGRDVQTLNTGALSADDFISAKYSLKAQYQERATWLIHRNTIAAIRKLKDANNNYIWSTGLAPGGGFQGTPETILARPYLMSEYVPNTLSSGKYIAILGDFSRYVIADALDMQMQVVDQLYAETNQTGYIARKETDGMPVLEEAFARLIIK